jgi:hypothetical protein
LTGWRIDIQAESETDSTSESSPEQSQADKTDPSIIENPEIQTSGETVEEAIEEMQEAVEETQEANS